MVQRIPQRDISAPWTKNGYRYRHRYDPGNEYPVYQRQPVLSAEWDDWETLLMPTSARPTASFILGGMSISPDNAIMALAEDYLSPPVRPAFPQSGDRELVSRNAGERLTGFCLGERFRNGLLRQKARVDLLPWQVWRHTVGTASADDELVYEEKDETFYVSLHKTSSRHYVIISSPARPPLKSCCWMPNCPTQPLCFLPRRKDHEYSLDHFQHSFYLRSNREGKNFGLYKTKVRDERKWEVLIPAREQVMLEGFTLFTDWLVVEERQRG
jgi:oligopeptidase B